MIIDRAYRIKELAELYGVSTTTFKKWVEPILPELSEIGYDVKKRLHTPKQCQLIVDFLGEPE